jgi:long-chain acyl-CoA synthetase
MVTRFLYEQAQARPEQIALVYGDERITFGDLLERVERLADGLARQDLVAGEAVGLVLHNDPTFVTSFYAVTALGATVVPVNPAFKQPEIEFCFRSAEVRHVISDERTAGVCERIAATLDSGVEVISTSTAHGQSRTLDSLLAEGNAERLAPRAANENFIYQFSSGSTGRPKRVLRTHGQCAAEAALYKSLGLTHDDRIFCAVPLFSSWGMGSCLLAAAISGATLVILESPHPFLLRRRRALELLEGERITFFPGVPFHFRLLAEAPGDADISSLRLCFSAGTALPRASFEDFGQRFGILVRQLYGSTETGMIAANMTDDPVATFESVGRALDGVTVEILDENDLPVQGGDVGEVAVSSPAASDGYAQADTESNEAFRDGKYFTGDLGRVDDDGLLYLEGRKKLLIEIGGYKVDPIEVEDVIVAHPSVSEAIVVGVAGDVEGEETIKAVVVPSGECDARELTNYCSEQLASFKVPRVVEFRDEIPKSPLGKILRKYLV